MRVLHLHSAFNGLNETVYVARTTWTLIPNTSGKVISADVSQIKILWYFMIWNMVGSSVAVSEFLSPVRSSPEFICLFAKLFISRLSILCKSFFLTALSLVIINIHLVQNWCKGVVSDMVHVLLLFDIQFHRKLKLCEALRLVESCVVCTQHA